MAGKTILPFFFSGSMSTCHPKYCKYYDSLVLLLHEEATQTNSLLLLRFDAINSSDNVAIAWHIMTFRVNP